MKYILTISLILFATPLAYTSSFQKECMPGIPLSELRKKYDEQRELLKNTDSFKKIDIRQKEYVEKQMVSRMALGKCNSYKSGCTGVCAWINGCSEKDCENLPKYHQEMVLASQQLQYALSRANESNPEFAELAKCIQEREYNDLSVSEI